MDDDTAADMEAAIEACRRAISRASGHKAFRLCTLLEMLISELAKMRAEAMADGNEDTSRSGLGN